MRARGGPRAAAFIVRWTAITAPPLVPELRLHLATDVMPLWKAIETKLRRAGVPPTEPPLHARGLSGDKPRYAPEPPYWAFVWAGGQALARRVLDEPALVAGRRVLDFAAGSGLVAIAAAKAGAASVTAVDVDPLAHDAILLNAALNGVALEVLLGDLTGDAEARWEVILAGDVFYDPEMTARVLPWLRAQAAAGATVLIGDPKRFASYSPDRGVEEVGRCVVPTSPELEGRASRETRILRLR